MVFDDTFDFNEKWYVYRIASHTRKFKIRNREATTRGEQKF